MHPRLVAADGDHAEWRLVERLPRPRLVEPSVECGGDRDAGPSSQVDVQGIDVRVDEIELRLVFQDEIGGLAQIRLGIATETSRPQGRWNGPHVPPRNLRVAAGEGCDLMSPLMELAHDFGDDSLRPAVPDRWDCLERWRHLGDP